MTLRQYVIVRILITHWRCVTFQKNGVVSFPGIFKIISPICMKPVDLKLRHERTSDFDRYGSCFDRAELVWSDWYLSDPAENLLDSILCPECNMLHYETRRIVGWYFISDIYITIIIRRVRKIYFIEQQVFLTIHSLYNNKCSASYCPPSFISILIFKLWRTLIFILVFVLINGQPTVHQCVFFMTG